MKQYGNGERDKGALKMYQAKYADNQVHSGCREGVQLSPKKTKQKQLNTSRFWNF